MIATFAHGLLQYLTTPADNPLRDRQLEGLLLTLLELGPQALLQPQNYSIRAGLMCCASQALSGLQSHTEALDDEVRALGHELSRLYHVDHAQSLAVLLPAWLGAADGYSQDKLLQYAERVWKLRRGAHQQRLEAAISATDGFFRRMGLGTRLSILGLDAEVIPELLAQVQRPVSGRRAGIDLQACERLLLRAL